MAIKKRELYSTLWKSCDELRGGVEPHKYKDYILTLLFLKYASDLKKKNPNSRTLSIDEGYSYDDLVKSSTQPGLAQKVNDAMRKFADNNQNYQGIVNISDFNQLGPENERNHTISSLINLFSRFDFSHNHANDDDILGDAYEYLVRQFAVASGKSKGQFYTPAEVSRILAKIIEIEKAESNRVTLYDPACGSASLLIRAAEQSGRNISIYGQEISPETAALAMMNCFLHQRLGAEIWGNESTLSKPHFKEGNEIKKFDYVVVNPPFSDKKWDKDVDKTHDPRFNKYDLKSNGDYAWLLHVIYSMKDTGKAAVILPHGVLFRGGIEAQIRTDIIQQGLIQGIIGLPANLFYGTGIPACILMLDKSKANPQVSPAGGDLEGARGIFFIDASRDYIKDGNKNRLREQDIAKITETFLNRTEIEFYSHFATLEEIQKNEYNLNIPRYVQPPSDEAEQNLDAHIYGGIPTSEIDKFKHYWDVFPQLRKSLFKPLKERKGFEVCTVKVDEINDAILEAPGMKSLHEDVQNRFVQWRKVAEKLIAPAFDKAGNAKNIQDELQKSLREIYSQARLLDEYDVYQILMGYCAETMADDLYALCADGWEVARDIEREMSISKKGKETEKNWDGALIPKNIVIAQNFPDRLAELRETERQCDASQESLEQAIEEFKDGEDDPRRDCLNDKDEFTQTAANAALKQAKADKDKEAVQQIEALIKLAKSLSDADKLAKGRATSLDADARALYPKFTKADVIALLYAKWFPELSARLGDLYKNVAHRFAASLSELVERYANTLEECQSEVDALEARVKQHLSDMGI
ncbi:MAG: N-6 DNA methylase [Proteobacteria bacterium]|nr:N-6 DNA methylase [Pseudomonadota bacterium]